MFDTFSKRDPLIIYFSSYLIPDTLYILQLFS